MKRVSTGVKGFDDLVEGGFPEGSVILVSGSAGSGKTIFCTHFLLEGCKNGENVLLITLEQRRQDYLESLQGLGLGIEKFLDKKFFVESLDLLDEPEKGDLFDRIKAYVKEKNISRLVLDSLTAFQGYPFLVLNVKDIAYFKIVSKQKLVELSEQDILRLLVHRLISFLKHVDVTTLVISDIQEGSLALSSDGISEFMCDGVVLLKMADLSGGTTRMLRIIKMRGSRTSLELCTFSIDDSGINFNLGEK